MTKLYNELTPFEYQVIVEKATERPFTGEYYQHTEDGVYTCKQCNAHLFLSSHKFASSCGWPSFDDEIKGAVNRTLDADGRRTEITCANCGGHLGHVFEGEGLTEKNIRHCVNSVSMDFIPTDELYDTAYFASGCFWGTEYWLQKQEGVISTMVGYTGGDKVHPTYQEVCSKTTGHAEAVRVIFDSKKISYESLVKLFFNTHDPEQLNRQGPDIGEQYRSEIFYASPKQKEVADSVINVLIRKGVQVVTAVTKFNVFYEGEEYHRDYYTRKGSTPYCHVYKNKFE